MEEAKIPYDTVPVRNQESVESDGEELADAEAREDWGDADEPNAKRRKIDAGAFEASLPHQAVTKPRVAFRTKSEVDYIDDGYKWRKYGRKVVKNSPYPRSYYRCASSGCDVRKHVERDSTDARFVITTYEGDHNHDGPAAGNSSQPHGEELMDEAKIPYHTVPVRNQESIESDSEELADAEAREDEGDADEPNTKRRNIDAGASEASLPHQTFTKPIVNFRTIEVDTLDDGHRWRMYGQKVPIGNAYPRKYYQCASPGCHVRKRVGRDSTDAKFVITYKGNHNHDVPAAGNSSQPVKVNNTADHFQPIKVVAEKHPLLKDIEYGKKDQRPVLLQLKDEQITVSESDIVDTVVKDVKEKLKFVGSNGRIEDLLKRLEAKLGSANMVLNDAEEKQLTNQVVKEWLDDLKEVIFRADDLRDKINYEELRRKLEGASESSTLCATFNKSVEDEIAEILPKLEELTAQKDELGLKELTENIVSQSSHGAPLALKPEVYGREDDKEAIMKLALSDETYGDKVPMVLPTVATGGTSKTTLAEDLNAHPDLLPIIGEEMGDIAKTNLGEDLNAHREEIVNKCKGHPIAVKSVVALLHSIANPDKWRMILENDIWDLKLQENASKYVLPALWLSYRYLSPLLKRCLVYCSIFPKDYEFDKEKVILLWMAEGLLQSKRRTRVEDVGEDFFKILTSRSFFQRSVHDKSKFTMHDCVHDLATFVLGNFGFRLEDDNIHNIPTRTLHLSFMKEKIGNMRYFQGISEARYLRTFLPLESNQPFRDAVPLKELLTEKKCLRVLSLSLYPCIAELPDPILESKSLRYLDLSSTSIRNIPDTICTLYNLETLLLSNCENLTRLPCEIWRLINLRHLDFAGSPIKELPPRICGLKDLQTLTRFIVCKEHSRIEELGDLQQLHGEFEICGLENVVDVKKVSAAKLREKKFLTSLGLYWDGESCDVTLKEREILDLFQPYENLKALSIYGFAGETFPDWMGDQSFGNIVEVQLSECKNCCLLPPLGQLPSLKNLQISGFKSVVTIGQEFYSYGSSATEPFRSLEVLRFEDMAIWKELLFTKDQVFPRLKELVFFECPKLDVWLPVCFPKLTKLLVSHCRQLMPLLIPMTRQRFGSLEELEIFACPKQVIFLQGGLPSSLKKIKISRCNSLKLLHYKGFQHLTSLESLEIIECKELHRLPEKLPTHPFELSIVECPFLESGGRENGEDWPN